MLQLHCALLHYLEQNVSMVQHSSNLLAMEAWQNACHTAMRCDGAAKRWLDV